MELGDLPVMRAASLTERNDAMAGWGSGAGSLPQGRVAATAGNPSWKGTPASFHGAFRGTYRRDAGMVERGFKSGPKWYRRNSAGILAAPGRGMRVAR